MAVSDIGIPLGADTATSLPTALSGVDIVGIAAAKPDKRAVAMMGTEKTIVEKYVELELNRRGVVVERVNDTEIPLGSCEVVSLSKRVICECG
jgi:hypothetical protein